MVPVFIEKSLGYLFFNFKNRDDGLVTNLLLFKAVPKNIALTSEEFADGEHMPKVTAGSGVGDNKSPSLSWSLNESLSDLSSFAIVVQDLDVPIPSPITHLFVYDISTERNKFELGLLNSKKDQPSKNDYKFGYGAFKRLGYAGPRPILNHGPHRYVFQIFALNSKATINLSQLDGIPDLKAFINEAHNVIGYGQLTGIYERKA